MRRKISLYIDGRLADLDDDSFILFNYTMDDLSNPTIVKNSFSQQVTLPGTPGNDAIFGDAYRLDRRVDYNGGASGAGFNPSRKTPFAIYNEAGEILESGYCKLDSVTRKGRTATYKVSLYGGLGSYLYSLSYAEDGRKLSLADLDYLGSGDPGELDFTINATSVLDAWDELLTRTPGSMWGVINFAPAYNGFPDNFSPDKGLLSLPSVGLPDNVGGYSSKSGYGLVNLANKMDEWAVKDLRSYLQRPVLSVKALLDAVSDPDNNGGYSVDIDGDILTAFEDLWITLPTIPSLGSMKQTTGGLSVTMTSSATTGNDLGTFTIGGAVPSGSVVNATLRCKLRFNLSTNSYATLSLTGSNGTGLMDSSVLFLQMVAYGSDNSIVGGSGVKAINGSKMAAEAVGFTPPFPTESYEIVYDNHFDRVATNVYEFEKELSFKVEAQDVAYYKLMVYAYSCHSVLARGVWQNQYSGDGSTSQATLYNSYTTYFQAVSSLIVAGSGNAVTMTSSDALRSGAMITKQMLLSSSHTPAEYLVSLCKIFGLYFLTETDTKKVTIVPRNALYIDETIDLTGRVDVSRDMEIVPMVFDSKWYKFALEGVGGAFYDEYLDIEGIEYGVQMVDTGFDFNADVKELLDGNVFRNAATILQSSRYWNIITSGAAFIPSPFVDTGNTITRWNSAGETQDTPISVPPSSAVISYYNNEYNGYDLPEMAKMQFCDEAGKMVDGKDVLCYWNRNITYDSFKVTDDLPIMGAVNDGKPCWILDEGADVDVPCFSSYIVLQPLGTPEVYESLDFGMPRQLDIPGIYYREGVTIYDRAWKAYITDKYDVDTQVLRCRVDFKGIGMQVGHGLLRRFYWYAGSLWVLNKITTYSLTTYDPVECEFIRVQDKDNYLNGQSY